MDVIYSHTCTYEWVLARLPHRHLQPIVLPSLMLKPANVTHLQIEEDLIYTSVRQALGFDHLVVKASLARTVSHGISQ